MLALEGADVDDPGPTWGSALAFLVLTLLEVSKRTDQQVCSQERSILQYVFIVD